MWGQESKEPDGMRPGKDKMIKDLQDHSVEVPEGISISLLRSLYESTFNVGSDRGVPNENGNPLPEVDGAPSTSKPANASSAYFATMKQELELVRAKIQLAELELNLANKRVPSMSISNGHRLQSKDFSVSVGEFCGEKITAKKWITLLSTTVASYGGSEEDMYRVARGLIIGLARATINKSNVTNWRSLSEVLLERFNDTRSLLDVYRDLQKRRKRSDESLEAYISAMDELADDVIPGEDLVPIIIRGLDQMSLFTPMLASARSVQELLKLIPAFKRNTSLSVQEQRQQEPRQQQHRTAVPPIDKTCYNCREKGHVSTNCPKPQLRRKFSCFRCGATDHMMAACPRNTTAAIEESNTVEPYEIVSIIFHLDTGSTKIKTDALFDSGSVVTLIEKRAIPKDHPILGNILKETKYKPVGNNPNIRSFGAISLDIVRLSKITTVSAYVVEDFSLCSKLILGRDSLDKMSIKLIDVDVVDPVPPAPIDVKSCLCNELPFAGSETIASVVENNLNVNSKLIMCDFKALVATIMENYVNYEGERKPLDYEMKIVLNSSTPIFFRPRRLSYAEKCSVRKIINGLVAEGVIRPSHSEYASPIVLVKKKSGELRMCVDYRELNKITKRDNFPLPLIEDCVDYLANKKIFSVLDLKSGFHHVRLSDDSVKYTSFVVPDGQWEYLKCPFGLRNAPSVFQRFINRILRDFIDEGLIVVYLDDILIASVNFENHLIILKRVLQRLSEFNVELQLSKCLFAYSEVEYLGLIASGKGVRPGNAKTLAIEKFPVPKNSKETHSFVALCGYFRKFVKNFSIIATPLQRLVNIKSEKDFIFDENCMAAFYELKSILTSSPVLSIYDPKKETELHTDASALGFGAILLQRQEDGKFHPVAYFSKVTTESEKKLHSYVLETLAIYYALERFRIYLEGLQFTIVTDCNSLAQAFNKKDMNRSIGRYICEMMNYQFVVKHRSGANMCHVDALSRMPIVAAVDPVDIDIQLKALQSVDQCIIDLKSSLETSNHSKFELVDGTVYRKGRGGRLLFYVPQSLREEVIRTVHHKCGHFGISKTLEYLCNYYWFPGIKEAVSEFIKSCIKCIIFSAPTKKTEKNLHSIDKVPIPFHTIHMDHFGPLPAIINKKKHILAIIDGFTKMVKLYPVNATSTKESVCALQKYCEYYSRPVRVITDRGSCFTSSEFKSFVDKMNIQHIKVATCAPQANGQVERVNRTIKAMLGKLTSPIDSSDWSRKLGEVEFACNNTAQGSTGTSPAKLLFGVEQRGPVVDYLSEYLCCVRENVIDLDCIRQTASRKIKKSQEKSQKWYLDNSKGAKNYIKDDLVFISNIDTTVGKSKKLISKFKGPYRIDKVLPNDRYVVKDIDGVQVSQIPYDGVIEAKNIRLWVSKDGR